MKQAILYVPGLGDWRSRGQRIVIWLWRIYGVRSEVVRMQWRVSEPFAVKQQRLLDRVDRLHEQGYRVSLVGVSAGASAVVNTFAVRQTAVHRVVCLCGKLRHPETISSTTYQQNPGFAESLQALPSSLEAIPTVARKRILSIHPIADNSVPPEDTIIPSAETMSIPSSGHVLSIALGITIFSPLIISFIRKNR